ncbi:dehydrogenase [Paenibacillus nasutitermitis]|uniref:Dehydrogenase n=1 Tax=Paenibacillus nasutitermitis TaxID=1652958 RepID=A0A917DMS9_9BACL|nr:dehydrogenase [Paenibacillus nasutitermitis]
MKELKLGMISLDTSHVVAFTELLNDKDHPYHVAGGKVTAGYPGGSPDMHASFSRVEGYTRDLRDRFGVAIVNSPEEVAERCDAILLESVDGRAHLELFRKIAPYGKPVFIDKPFATTTADAQAMVQLARQYRVPIMSCSSLRYAAGLTEVLAAADETADGQIIGADCYGPTPLEERMPGLFTYGIHSVEMLYAVLGPGCVEVSTRSGADYDLAVGVWRDGRIGTVRGNRKGNYRFGAVIHREKSTQYADVSAHPKPFYAGLLEQVMVMFKTGAAPLAIEESLELIRFIEASNESALTGRPVKL